MTVTSAAPTIDHNPYSGQLVPPDVLDHEFAQRGANALFDDILRADHAKNHAGREYDADYVLKAFAVYAQLGGWYFHKGRVVIILKDADGVLEFHCLNAGGGKDLTGAINEMLTAHRSQFASAVTFYDNPRINELARYSKFPAVVDKVDFGLDATYRMTFDLRSA